MYKCRSCQREYHSRARYQKCCPDKQSAQTITIRDPKAPVSAPQKYAIEHRCNLLGMDARFALSQVSNMGEASTLISELEKRVKAAEKQGALTLGNQASHVLREAERRLGVSTPANMLPMRMVAMLKDGNYAVRRSEDTDRWVFFRVSHPKSGKLKGGVTVQTRHGGNLHTRVAYNAEGKITFFDSRNIEGTPLREWIILILGQQTEAMLDFAQQLEQCCRCCTSLTDARSRYYGIGPECENHMPWIIDAVNASKGEYAGE